MSKPLIGIVGREATSQVMNKSEFYVYDTYRMAVLKSGGIPFMILPVQAYKFNYKNLKYDRELNKEEERNLIKILDLCNGIIIPGGRKIFNYDKFIAKYALDKDIPIFGICLGMQVLAAVDCESEIVVKKIENGVNHQSDQDFVHNVKVDKSSRLYSMVENDNLRVNSRHKCNVLKTNNFDIVGYSDDGLIEAIERKDKKFALGVQWHPEMIYDKNIEAKKIFKEFIKMC